jgi:hypothetical protein
MIEPVPREAKEVQEKGTQDHLNHKPIFTKQA